MIFHVLKQNKKRFFKLLLLPDNKTVIILIRSSLIENFEV